MKKIIWVGGCSNLRICQMKIGTGGSKHIRYRRGAYLLTHPWKNRLASATFRAYPRGSCETWRGFRSTSASKRRICRCTTRARAPAQVDAMRSPRVEQGRSSRSIVFASRPMCRQASPRTRGCRNSLVFWWRKPCLRDWIRSGNTDAIPSDAAL